MASFRSPEKPSLPKGVGSSEELRSLMNTVRTQEIDRRLHAAAASGNPRLAAWLRARKQLLLGRQVPGNVSISGGLYTNKVYIPVQEFPESNFAGLIIGPKGATQKQLERITRARIYVRGSYKDRYAEPLHCYITAETQEGLRSASAVIENLIEEAVFFGEHTKLRMSQLRAMKGDMPSSKGLTDWEKFYYWWYFHTKVQRAEK